jgi:hypothetical protein
VLLVDANDSERPHGCEHRRARTDHDRRVAAGDPHALVAPLGLRQRRVEHGDALAETSTKTPERLRRQRDLRHEDDRSAITFERGRAGLQVDLGLAAAGRAVEEEVRALTRVQRRSDSVECRALRRAQRVRFGLTADERVALRGLPTFAARLALNGSDKRKRAARCRPVVIREPECELDECGRKLVDDTIDRRSVDPLRRRDVDFRDDAAPACVAEPDLDHRAWADVLGHLVREFTGERTRGDERIDGRVTGHRASL